MAENKVICTVCFDPDIAKAIDEERGLTKRSTYLNDLVGRTLGLKGHK